MLGKTHIATGIAASLVIMHPDTLTGIIAATVGGMLGGWICDLDCRDSEIDEGGNCWIYFNGCVWNSNSFFRFLFGKWSM